MIILKNEKGIALVMVLVLALIGLMIVSALLYLATSGTLTSGAFKAYRTAEEASYGGAEIAAEYAANRGSFPLLGASFTSGCNCADPLVPTDNTDLDAGGARTCRCDKLCNATADWPPSCDENAGVAGVQVNLSPEVAFDFSRTLGTYDVFAKIVDTVTGNSDMGGIVASGELGGQGVVTATTGIVNPPQRPYLYRMEIDARATSNPREHSRLSILYAY